jgi:hypothetical protein
MEQFLTSKREAGEEQEKIADTPEREVGRERVRVLRVREVSLANPLPLPPDTLTTYPTAASSSELMIRV